MGDGVIRRVRALFRFKNKIANMFGVGVKGI